MIKKFLSLEWKQFFRSSYWEKSLAFKILLGLLGLYFLVVFLILGVSIYPALKKTYPDKDPLKLVNNILIFAFLAEMIVRYFLQKLPTMQVKPLLALPVSKKNITHYLLGKSALSFYNLLPLFALVPFSIMLLINDYDKLSVIAWFISVYSISLSLNYLNFLINKKTQVLIATILFLAGSIALLRFNILPVNRYFGQAFTAITENPVLVLIPLLILVALYYLNYKNIQNNLYLDNILGKENKNIKTSELKWTSGFGKTGIFLKNDIRLIWRNKRPKTLFLMSFFFLFYGLMFFANPIYDKMPIIYVFVAIFITGMFTLNFGQLIPAWDSAYYPLLMTQNLKYREYLESKWILMVVMTVILFLLSIPYVYFGIDKLLLFVMSLFFNLGFTSLFVLYMGSYNRKRVDLERGAMMNYQGANGTQFITAFIIMLLPMALFYLITKLAGFNAGIIFLSIIGLTGLVFKNYFMNKIEQQYLKNKYITIHSFKQKN